MDWSTWKETIEQGQIAEGSKTVLIHRRERPSDDGSPNDVQTFSAARIVTMAEATGENPPTDDEIVSALRAKVEAMHS